MFFPVIIRKTTKLLKNPFEYTAALCCILIWLKTPVPHQHFYIKHIGKFNKGCWKIDVSDAVLMSRAHSTDRCPSGPQDKIFLAVVEGMKQLASCICLLTALGTEPTSLQITALAECIQIITTQRPSQLLLLRHFLCLRVTRKHLFEGWASHKFRSTWIYGKVRWLLSQVVLFFPPSLGEGAFEVLIARLLLSQKGFWPWSGSLSSWLFAFFHFISSFISWDIFQGCFYAMFIYIPTAVDTASHNTCEESVCW